MSFIVLFTIYMILILMFSTIYFTMDKIYNENINKTFLDYFTFSMSIQSGLGYTPFIPNERTSRYVRPLQIISYIMLLCYIAVR